MKWDIQPEETVAQEWIGTNWIHIENADITKIRVMNAESYSAQKTGHDKWLWIISMQESSQLYLERLFVSRNYMHLVVLLPMSLVESAFGKH